MADDFVGNDFIIELSKRVVYLDIEKVSANVKLLTIKLSFPSLESFNTFVGNAFNRDKESKWFERQILMEDSEAFDKNARIFSRVYKNSWHDGKPAIVILVKYGLE